MCAAALVGDVKKARELNLRLFPLHQKLFVEANPIPVKWALAEMGMIERGLRLPMSPLAEKFHQTVREALHEAGHRASRPARRGRTRLMQQARRCCGRAGRAVCAVASRYRRSTTRRPARCRRSKCRPTSPRRRATTATRFPTARAPAPRCRATRPSGASSRRARRARPPCCPRSSACASSAPARSAGWWCRSRRRSSGRW